MGKLYLREAIGLTRPVKKAAVHLLGAMGPGCLARPYGGLDTTAAGCDLG